jgi:hypothetical protein
MKSSISVAIAFVALLFVESCTEKTPDRNHIPVLKQQVYRLQEAVKERNSAAIDSLLSPKILRNNQNSDSLLHFVYGDDQSTTFSQFGNCEIAYTKDQAIINCVVLDGHGEVVRPITFVLELQQDLWLFTQYFPEAL